MTKPLFVQSPACTGRTQCVTCRDRVAGAAWRLKMAAAFDVPGGMRDFDCPHGIAWGGGQTLWPVEQCHNCGGRHATAACPIPAGFDGDYRKDSRGSDGCNCA